MVAVPLDTVGNPPDALPGTLAPAHDLVRRGQVRRALTDLAGLLAPRAEPLEPSAHTVATSLLAECHLAQGDLGAALALGDTLAAAGDDAWAHHARAEIASATGEPDLAVERFRSAGTAATGADDLLVPWRAGAALALLRVGQRAEALDLARTQHALAQTAGASYDVALALRVLATTGTPTGTADSANREDLLAGALDLLAATDAARLRAQVETDLAGLRLLGGARDEALALLRSAEDYAGREDLWPLQSRIRRLLDRMGEVPRRAEAEALAVLTAAERRVALLALEGLSNRGIAEQLSVTVKAVEGHLSKVYRKLGLSSRGALVASFSAR